MEINRIQSPGGDLISPVTPLSAQQRAERQEIIRAVESVQKAQLFGEYNELTFAFDRASTRPILRIVDKRTREVVRQIPAEYLLRLAEDLKSQ